MNDHARRQQRLVAMLSEIPTPIRGDDLAKALGVTRQVIVHDIALLRASGTSVVATPRGYYLESGPSLHARGILAVRHDVAQTADELYTLVDHGIIIVNVLIEHPLYGELSGALRIRSRLDVDQFLADVNAAKAHLLLDLTDGYHMHTVEYLDGVSLDKAIVRLRQLGIQVFP